MGKRLCGGSSPRKEQKYKNNFTTVIQNKIRKAEKRYKALCKASKKAQEAGKARRFYFHKKYKSFEAYLKTINIKKEVQND